MSLAAGGPPSPPIADEEEGVLLCVVVVACIVLGVGEVIAIADGLIEEAGRLDGPVPIAAMRGEEGIGDGEREPGGRPMGDSGISLKDTPLPFFLSISSRPKFRLLHDFRILVDFGRRQKIEEGES